METGSTFMFTSEKCKTELQELLLMKTLRKMAHISYTWSHDRLPQPLTCMSVVAGVGDGATTNLSWSSFSGSMSTITSLQPLGVRYHKQTNTGSV